MEAEDNHEKPFITPKKHANEGGNEAVVEKHEEEAIIEKENEREGPSDIVEKEEPRTAKGENEKSLVEEVREREDELLQHSVLETHKGSIENHESSKIIENIEEDSSRGHKEDHSRQDDQNKHENIHGSRKEDEEKKVSEEESNLGMGSSGVQYSEEMDGEPKEEKEEEPVENSESNKKKLTFEEKRQKERELKMKKAEKQQEEDKNHWKEAKQAKNDGKIIIEVLVCQNCEEHQWCTRHDPAKYNGLFYKCKPMPLELPDYFWNH